MFDDTNILSGVSFTLLRSLGRYYHDDYLRVGAGTALVLLKGFWGRTERLT